MHLHQFSQLGFDAYVVGCTSRVSLSDLVLFYSSVAAIAYLT